MHVCLALQDIPMLCPPGGLKHLLQELPADDEPAGSCDAMTTKVNEGQASTFGVC